MCIEHDIKIKGFTLIEFIMVLAITAILAGSISVFMSRPIIGYVNTASRNVLVNKAELVLQRMGRDIQRSVPNSVRVSGTSLEYMNTVDTIRYRAFGANKLNFNVASTGFDVIGNFTNALGGAQGYYVIIYNTGATTGLSVPVPGSNVYATPSKAVGTIPPSSPPAGSSVITDAGTATITINTPPTADQINISGGGLQFAFTSPQQRLYVSDGPVSYICNLGLGTIVRYSGYTIASTQPTAAPGGASAGTLANNVSACTFTYTPGTTARNGVVSLQISLTESGETVTLMHQVSLRNLP